MWLKTSIFRTPSPCHGRLKRVGGLVGVVGAADERSRFDVDESEIERDGFQVAELVGMVVAEHRSVILRWSEVLTDGQNLTSDAPQVPERRDELVMLLAKAHHHTRLGWDIG